MAARDSRDIEDEDLVDVGYTELGFPESRHGVNTFIPGGIDPETGCSDQLTEIGLSRYSGVSALGLFHESLVVGLNSMQTLDLFHALARGGFGPEEWGEVTIKDIHAGRRQARDSLVEDFATTPDEDRALARARTQALMMRAIGDAQAGRPKALDGALKAIRLDAELSGLFAKGGKGHETLLNEVQSLQSRTSGKALSAPSAPMKAADLYPEAFAQAREVVDNGGESK